MVTLKAMVNRAAHRMATLTWMTSQKLRSDGKSWLVCVE